jgi:hypothetical protein
MQSLPGQKKSRSLYASEAACTVGRSKETSISSLQKTVMR